MLAQMAFRFDIAGYDEDAILTYDYDDNDRYREDDERIKKCG